jgi:hypothetical protein
MRCYDYWALGHIHKRGVIEGPSVIVMPGIPQGRDIGEDGPKSATLASIMDDGTISIEERPTALAEFSRIRIDISGIEAWDDLAGTIGRQLTSARQLAIARELVVRLTLTGTTPLAWRMRRDADLLFEEARARANRVGSVWIEKLDIDCEPPPAGGHSDADPLVEMQAIIKHRVLGSQGFEAAFAIIAEQLQGSCPRNCAICSDATRLKPRRGFNGCRKTAQSLCSQGLGRDRRARLCDAHKPSRPDPLWQIHRSRDRFRPSARRRSGSASRLRPQRSGQIDTVQRLARSFVRDWPAKLV